VAVNDFESTPQNTPITIDVLANDVDPNNVPPTPANAGLFVAGLQGGQAVVGHPMTVFSYTGGFGTAGYAILNADGTITYMSQQQQPPGKVSFTYDVSNGTQWSVSPATVTVTVYDATNPTVTLSSDAGDPISSPIAVHVSFSEAVSGFSLAGIATTNATASGLVRYSAMGVDLYSFTLTPAEKGPVSATVLAGAAQEIGSGNPNLASDPFTRTFARPATPAAFDPATATWYLRSSHTPGAPDAGTFAYGASGWVSIVGDWNGDGRDSIGVFDPSTATWYLRNSNSPGAPDIAPFQYGAPGWIPVVGDGEHTGHTGIGVFDPTAGNWYLRNEAGPGAPDANPGGVPFAYGAPGWTPVAGDWSEAGHAGVGVFDPATARWYLRTEVGPGAPDADPGAAPFAYGSAGWKPVVGDWAGRGRTTIGVVNPTTEVWYLRNSNTPGAPDITPFAYGGAGWNVVAGDWTAPTLPQLAAGGPHAGLSAMPPLTEAGLQYEVSGALGRLSEAGADPTLIARLGRLSFQVGQLSGGELAVSDVAAGRVVVDARAAGWGWFVDPTPLQDEEFAGGLALPGSAASGRMDLLTVLLHEMGHFNGWTEFDPATNPDALMALTLGAGTRRTQALDAVVTQSPS
jgi:hypothetical protein